jgi:hypothetical protein
MRTSLNIILETTPFAEFFVNLRAHEFFDKKAWLDFVGDNWGGFFPPRRRPRMEKLGKALQLRPAIEVVWFIV